jgi:hypothetical protein
MSWYHSGIGFFINSTLTMSSVYLAVWLVFLFSLTDSLTVRAGSLDRANALTDEANLITTVSTAQLFQLGMLSVMPYWGELCLETGFLEVPTPSYLDCNDNIDAAFRHTSSTSPDVDLFISSPKSQSSAFEIVHEDLASCILAIVLEVSGLLSSLFVSAGHDCDSAASARRFLLLLYIPATDVRVLLHPDRLLRRRQVHRHRSRVRSHSHTVRQALRVLWSLPHPFRLPAGSSRNHARVSWHPELCHVDVGHVACGVGADGVTVLVQPCHVPCKHCSGRLHRVEKVASRVHGS